MNVDGCIAVSFVDLLRDSGAFTPEEAEEYTKIGTLNGLFVLGRSIGFIGHHLGVLVVLLLLYAADCWSFFSDQKRLKAPLYRHPGIISVILSSPYDADALTPLLQPTTSSLKCLKSHTLVFLAR